ncbi:MAG: M23 family metallopeptidase [Caldisericia bacterium]|nr:M23 family metallopeptidase [Caldisericia bacterium]
MLLKPKSVSRDLTMMVVPHYDSPVRILRIPLAVVYGLVIVAVFSISVLGFYANKYAQAESNIETLRQGTNRRLVDLQRENLHILNNKLTKIENQYAVIEQFIDYAGGIDKEVKQSIGVVSQDQSWATLLKENNLDYEPVPKPASNDMPEAYSTIEKEGKKIFENENEWARNLNRLKLNSEETKKIIEHTPSGWPSKGRLTSPWGWREWTNSFHEGVDIINTTGTPIHATASGKVTLADWSGGYGNCVDVDHGGGIVTRYGHCEQILVKVGETVKVGQVIALMGATGNADCPHVHYEIRINGKSVDPEKFPF